MSEITDNKDDFVIGTKIMLDLFSRPDIKQVVLLDGPVVFLGGE